MSQTFLVLVHDAPTQLRALLDLVLADGSRAVVHVDAKSSEADFRTAVGDLGDRVHFTSRRHDVRWGGFGAVAATLTALREAVDHVPADHYVLLSGADLPIRPATELHEELTPDVVHMDCWPMPDERRGKPLSRVERWHHAPRHRTSRVGYRVNQVLQHLPRRDVATGLAGAQPHAGSQWWAMPHDAAAEVLQFVDRSPRFVRFFRHVEVPDEIFFPTVLKALPRQWATRPSLTYTRWSGGISPDQLDSSDVPLLAETGAFFARKFSLAADPGVVVAVKTHLLTSPHPTSDEGSQHRGS